MHLLARHQRYVGNTIASHHFVAKSVIAKRINNYLRPYFTINTISRSSLNLQTTLATSPFQLLQIKVELTAVRIGALECYIHRKAKHERLSIIQTFASYLSDTFLKSLRLGYTLFIVTVLSPTATTQV